MFNQGIETINCTQTTIKATKLINTFMSLKFKAYILHTQWTKLTTAITINIALEASNTAYPIELAVLVTEKQPNSVTIISNRWNFVILRSYPTRTYKSSIPNYLPINRAVNDYSFTRMFVNNQLHLLNT